MGPSSARDFCNKFGSGKRRTSEKFASNLCDRFNGPWPVGSKAGLRQPESSTVTETRFWKGGAKVFLKMESLIFFGGRAKFIIFTSFGNANLEL